MTDPRTPALLLAFAVACYGQVSASFSPQPTDPRLPGLTPWAIEACNGFPAPVALPAGKLCAAAQGHFAWVGQAELARLADQQARLSTGYKLALAGELVSLTAVSAEASYQAFRRVQPGQSRLSSQLDRWTAALGPPLLVAFKGAQAILKRERQARAWTPPTNILDRWVAIPGQGCVSLVVYGRVQEPQTAFTVEVKP